MSELDAERVPDMEAETVRVPDVHAVDDVDTVDKIEREALPLEQNVIAADFDPDTVEEIKALVVAHDDNEGEIDGAPLTETVELTLTVSLCVFNSDFSGPDEFVAEIVAVGEIDAEREKLFVGSPVPTVDDETVNDTESVLVSVDPKEGDAEIVGLVVPASVNDGESDVVTVEEPVVVLDIEIVAVDEADCDGELENDLEEQLDAERETDAEGQMVVDELREFVVVAETVGESVVVLDIEIVTVDEADCDGELDNDLEEQLDAERETDVEGQTVGDELREFVIVDETVGESVVEIVVEIVAVDDPDCDGEVVKDLDEQLEAL